MSHPNRVICVVRSVIGAVPTMVAGDANSPRWFSNIVAFLTPRMVFTITLRLMVLPASAQDERDNATAERGHSLISIYKNPSFAVGRRSPVWEMYCEAVVPG